MNPTPHDADIYSEYLLDDGSLPGLSHATLGNDVLLFSPGGAAGVTKGVSGAEQSHSAAAGRDAGLTPNADSTPSLKHKTN